jgi:hypothetical protein
METKIEYTLSKLPTNHVGVLETTIYILDGNELTRKNHRCVISPLDDYSTQAKEVKEFCDFIFTYEIKEEFRKAQEAINEKTDINITD